MENDEVRYSASRLSRRRDKIKMAGVAAVFFLCSAAIFATKYRQDLLICVRTVGTEQTATNTDARSGETAADPDAAERQTSETAAVSEETSVTEETPTEADSMEETMTVEGGAAKKYVNLIDPDVSEKGDDWYDPELYDPGNVTDDAFFDTAVLIGDSRTEGLGLYAGLSNLDIFASNGLNIEKVMTDAVVSTTDGTVTVLDALRQKQYDSIYVSFGINELGWAYDDVFIEEYKTFIDAVREEQPDATIYVENILPVSKALSEEDEIYNNPNIEKYNGLIKEMCKEYGDVIYLDVASSVAVDGALPEDASTDGRHCNKEYCEKWMDYIRKNVYIKK